MNKSIIILKQGVKVKANKTKRTYTLQTYAKSICGIVIKLFKYETKPMSKDEFDFAAFWTDNEWKQYLINNQNYKCI